jgi:hypothetical protein
MVGLALRCWGNRAAFSLLGALLLVGPRAAALPAPEQDVPHPPPGSGPSYLVPLPKPPSDTPGSIIGVETLVGAGATGFIDSGARAFVDMGALWDLRLVLGSRTRLALEAAYVGSEQALKGLGNEGQGRLIGNGAEAALRLNIRRRPLQPYVFGGFGWTNYRLGNGLAFNSDQGGSDNVFLVPLGAGVSLRWDAGFVVDVRGTLRLTYSDALLSTPSVSTSLRNWTGTARLGYEF